jgi:type II secretory pathway pseudopilin PulG
MSYCAQCGTDVPAGAAACPNCGRPAPGAAPGGAAAKQSNRTLVMVLVGCGVVFVGIGLAGIFAAILIPNFLDALQKAKQKRTLAEMWKIVGAVELYKAKLGSFPAAADMNALAKAVSPYGPPPSRVDAWNRELRYACWRQDAASPGCDHYRIVSAGRDGRFEHDDLRSYPAAPFDPTDYDRDIVFGDGAPIAWPTRAPPPAR